MQVNTQNTVPNSRLVQKNGHTESGTGSDDLGANETSPAPENMYDVSQNLVSGKRRKIEHSDSKPNKIFPEKASGKDRLVSHGYYAPTGNSTNERGNPETNSRNTAEHRSSATKSGKPSYTNKPLVNPRSTEQSDSESDGNKRRRIATKHEDAIDGDIRRTPMTIRL